MKVFKRSAGSKLIAFANTAEAKTGDVFCTEETPLEPMSLYGQTKTQAEQELLESPNVITLRLATVFGMSPRMRLDLLVNHFVYAAATDSYIVIFEKDFKRNYIHIRDVADCFVYCIEHAQRMAGRPYNAGLDAANLSKEELALKIKELMPNFYVHFAEVGSDPDKRNYIVSNQRLRDAGFETKRSLEEGIQELFKGYRMMGRGSFKNRLILLLINLRSTTATDGCRRVVLCTGYFGEQVARAFGKNYGPLRLVYSQEQTPVGTGGALRLALSHIESDPVLVMNGDSYCDTDLNALWNWHRRRQVTTRMVLARVARS